MYNFSAALWPSLLGIGMLATAQGQSQTGGASSQDARSTCHIAEARRSEEAAGSSRDRAKAPTAVESDCSDDRSSMMAATTAPEDAQKKSPANPSSGALQPPALTLTCYFSSGPHAGVIGDLAGVPGAIPVPVGSSCSDGAASSGTAVIRSIDSAAKLWSDASRANGVGAGRPGSTICQFMSGPKAHGWHDYAPLPAAPIGSSCQDGTSSAGVVMASGHGERY